MLPHNRKEKLVTIGLVLNAQSKTHYLYVHASLCVCFCVCMCVCHGDRWMWCWHRIRENINKDIWTHARTHTLMHKHTHTQNAIVLTCSTAQLGIYMLNPFRAEVCVCVCVCSYLRHSPAFSSSRHVKPAALWWQVATDRLPSVKRTHTSHWNNQ